MKVSWDDEIPNIWKVIKFHVPNHQPEFYKSPLLLVKSPFSYGFPMVLPNSNHNHNHIPRENDMEEHVKSTLHLVRNIRNLDSTSERTYQISGWWLNHPLQNNKCQNHSESSCQVGWNITLEITNHLHWMHYSIYPLVNVYITMENHNF